MAEALRELEALDSEEDEELEEAEEAEAPEDVVSGIDVDLTTRDPVVLSSLIGTPSLIAAFRRMGRLWCNAS